MQDIVNNYFGDTFFLIILLFGVVCILIKRDSKVNKKLLYALGGFCVSFPILFVIFAILGMKSVFYRVLWILPLSLITGIGFTWIQKRKKDGNSLYVLCICILILLVGNICFEPNRLSFPENIYKLDDEVIEVAKIMEEDSEKENIIVIGEMPFMIQIRQYSPRFWWGYTNRNCMIYADTRNEWDESARLAGAIQNNYFPSSMDVLKDLETLKIDYLVIYQNNIFIDKIPKEKYAIVGETMNYKVLKMDYS